MSDLRNRVAGVLDKEVLPSLAMESGVVEVVDVAEGVARVRLRGACSGCPSSVMAIIMGIELELCKRLPEVHYLELVP